MASLPSLDMLLESVPPENLDAPCKDVHLCEIALSITDWEVIAPFLEISRAEAEEINRDEGKTVPQRIGMLRKWKEKFGRRATYRRLAKRFMKVKRVDLVDEICRVLGDSDSSSDDDSTTADHEVIVHQTIIDQYADHLRRMYPKELPTFAHQQWPPSPTHKFFNLAMIQRSRVQLGPIDEHYIRLTQRGNVDDIMLNKAAIQVKDIFHLFYGSSKRLIVLIEGAPGAGKSTLAWYICDQWGSGNLFGEFKLVVFVQLRSPAVQTATSVADLLPRMASGREREILSHLETRCGRDVLFILDGWDEYNGGLSRDSICGKLICSPGSLSMHESTLLITSRPVASGELQRYCSTRFEIVGFSPKEVKAYFKESLKEAHQEEQQAEVLQECLKVRPVIQASCYLPLNAAIVVHLFITGKNTLPTTLHGLFTSLVLNCIVRHLTKQEEGKHVPKIRSFETIPTELQPHFQAISALAFYGIMTNKSSFSEEELHSFGLATESSAPLLSLIQGWSIFKSSWEDLSFSFFHLSVQELLAAFHISEQSHMQQVDVFRELFGKPRFAAVLSFYAAFTKFGVDGIRKFIKEALQRTRLAVVEVNVSSFGGQLSVRELHKTILDCLFEAQDPSLCQYIATVMEGTLTVEYTMTPFLCMVLGYFLRCLCLTPGGRKLHIDFDSPHLDEYKCSYLVNELKKCSHGQLSLSLREGEAHGGVFVLVRMLRESCSHCISELSLSLQPHEHTLEGLLLNHSAAIPLVALTILPRLPTLRSIGSQGGLQQQLAPLADYLTSKYPCTLKVLNLSRCVIPDRIAHTLATFVTTTSVLDTLNISGSFILKKDASVLAGSLARMSNLDILISGCRPPESAGILAVALAVRSTQDLWNLSGHTLPSEGVKMLTDALTDNPALRTLNLSRCIIALKDAAVLACLLARNSDLEVLISGCTPPESAGRLAVALAVRSTEGVWDLSGHTIPLEGIRMLTDALANNPALKKLNFSQCNIPAEGVTVLACFLARNLNSQPVEVIISGCTPQESAGRLAVALAVRSTEEAWDLSGHTIPLEGIRMLTDALANNPALKKLNLSQCNIPAEGVTILARFLARNLNSQPVEVIISECIPAESAGILAVALAVRSTKESWDLSGHTVPPEGVNMLADSFDENPNLKALNLSGCSISPQGALELACNLVRNTNLEVLITGCSPPESTGILAVALTVRSTQEAWDLSGHTIPPEGMKMLVDFLARNPSVKILNFSDCTIASEGMRIFGEYLDKTPSLETLNLSQCIIPLEVALVLSDFLATNYTLETVYFSGCSPPASVGAIAVALKIRSVESTCNLSGHTIPLESAKALADFLKSNSTVDTLNLSRSKISQEGIRLLLQSMSKNHHIKELNFCSTELSEQSILALAKAVGGSETLEILVLSETCMESYSEIYCLIGYFTLNPPLRLNTLDVSSCRIGLQSAKALEPFLAASQTLEVLILSNNDLSSACASKTCAQYLAQGLRQNKSLKSLSIARCVLSNNNAVVIVEALKHHPSLQELDLSGNLLRKREIQALNERLKEGCILRNV